MRVQITYKWLLNCSLYLDLLVVVVILSAFSVVILVVDVDGKAQLSRSPNPSKMESIRFLSHSFAEIPSYLFTSPDASLHIFDFLSNSTFGAAFFGDGTSGGSLMNWTTFCEEYGNAVLGYGPFVGCLLYPNVTRNVQDGTLPANLTEVGFYGERHRGLAFASAAVGHFNLYKADI